MKEDDNRRPATPEQIENMKVCFKLTLESSYHELYVDMVLLDALSKGLMDDFGIESKVFAGNLVSVHANVCYANLCLCVQLRASLKVEHGVEKTPSDDIVIELRETLRWLFYAYRLIDMPLEVDAEKDINWAIHSELIGVRGDGYMQHVQEVFKEMFFPHSSFFEKRYGFKVEELFEFFIDVEDRILCKIGSQDMVAEG